MDIKDSNFKSIEYLENLNPNFLQLRLKPFDLTAFLQTFDRELQSILEPLRNHQIALLFSGGIDSSILAFKLNQLNINYQPILVAKENEVDYKNAREIAKILNINLNIIELNMGNYEGIIPEIMKIIETTEEKQINISAPFFLAADYMRENNLEVAILGQGADELFCGYQRYVDFIKAQHHDFDNYHIRDMKKSIIKNYKRDCKIFSNKKITTYLPYIDKKIIEISISIPNNILIDFNVDPPIKKNFLRLYAEMLRLDKAIIQKKKVAIQFGSGSYKLLRKLALKHGFTKPFSQKHGYLSHVQLYLDYLAQINNIKNYNLNLD